MKGIIKNIKVNWDNRKATMVLKVFDNEDYMGAMTITMGTEMLPRKDYEIKLAKVINDHLKPKKCQSLKSLKIGLERHLKGDC